MPKSDILLVGLDIGTTKICTLIAEVAEGQGSGGGARDGSGGQSGAALRVLGVGVAPSTGVRRGVIVDIEQTVRAIQESVEQAQRVAGADIHAVVVGVTGEHIASLNSRGVVAITHAHREITEEDVQRVGENSRVIVLPPDREIIHAIPRGYAIDGQNGIRSPVGMSGTRLEVETHIVTGATSFLRNVVTCVERAGLRIEDMVLEPIATAEAVLLPAEREMGVALVDIGGGTSDLAIFQNGDICYSSVVPVGGEYVTKDIAAGLRVAFEEAERIKLAHGIARVADVPRVVGGESPTFPFTYLGGEAASLPLRTLGEIIEPRVEELFQLVDRAIQRSGYANRLPAGLVLSGGGAQLRGLRELAGAVTSLPVRIGQPGPEVASLSETVQLPAYATAVGLLRWAESAIEVVPTHDRGGNRRDRNGSLLDAISQYLRRILGDVLGR